MLLRFFKSYSPVWRQAQELYSMAVAAARAPHWYRDLGVPDTLDGRFDMITLHVYVLLQTVATGNPRLAQALFDVMFVDMENNLREMGVGDLGVPKKVKAMMRAFNGRVHAYRLGSMDGTLAEVIRRNVYGTVHQPNAAHVSAVADRIHHLISTGWGHEKTTAA